MAKTTRNHQCAKEKQQEYTSVPVYQCTSFHLSYCFDERFPKQDIADILKPVFSFLLYPLPIKAWQVEI